MGFLDLFKGYRPKRLANLWSPAWIAAAGGYPSKDGTEVPTPQTSLGLSGIRASINLLTDPLAGQPLRLMQANPAGGAAQVRGLDVANALRRWSFVDKEFGLFQMLADGNAFVAIRRNDRGGVSHLETINGALVQVAVDDSGAKWYEVQEDANLNRPAEVIPDRNMIHLIYRSQADGVMGISPLVSVAPSLELPVMSRRSTTAIHRNISMPSVVLTSPNKLGKDSATRLKEQWIDKTGGENQGKAAVLDNGFDAKVLSPGTALESQAAEMAEISIKTISHVYGIPSVMLGSSTSGAAYGTAVEILRQFHSTVLNPLSRRVSDAISRKLLNEEQQAGGMFVQIEMSSLVRGHGEQLANTVSTLLNSGAVDLNTARAWLALEPVSNGEVSRAPVNVVSLDYWADEYRPGSNQEQPAPASGDQKLDAKPPVQKFSRSLMKLKQVLNHAK